LKSRGFRGWLLAALVLASGCSGILLESQDQGGKVDRLKLDGTETWDSYDDRPRHPYVKSGKRGVDDIGIMLKSETSF